MTSIVKATEKDFHLISEIAKQSFVESHGNSAGQEDIDIYITGKYNKDVIKEELSDAKNIYHIIYHNNQAAGYSKIILNTPYPNSPLKNIAKLERLYLLKEFYDLQLGFKLFQCNVELVKTNQQMGIWLFVWKENQRAVDFYNGAGFHIIGTHDFPISETHTNPNHQMLLLF